VQCAGVTDRELKKGGKVTRLEEEAKELEKAVIKLHTQAEIKEGTIKDEESAWRQLNVNSARCVHLSPSQPLSFRFHVR
jgi:hypothetical protein